MTDNEKALDILQKLDFFYGQRAGRELWNEKPTDVQNEDIDNFKRDVAFLEDFINRQNSNIEELKSKNSNPTSDLSSLRTEIERLQNTLDDVLDREPTLVERSEKYAKAEAVKEFAEMVKETAVTNITVGGSTYYCVGLHHLDNLVKEFTEGDPK